MDDATFFRQATTQICGGTLDPHAVLERCFSFLKEFIPMESIAMAVYDREIQSLRNVAYVVHSPYEHLVPSGFWETPVHIPFESFKRLLSLGNDKCLIINDAASDVGGRKICELLGVNDISYILLKVNVGKDIPGHIVVGSRGRNLYSEDHARLLNLIRDPFSIAMTNAVQHQEVVRLKDLLSEDNRYLSSKLRQKSENEIIGKDHGLKVEVNTAMQVAKLNSPVMLLGETGVGKELFANVIHYHSQHANGPFIKINCGAIPDNLIDSELFGHEKGAFTGALATRRGHFERSHNGTLFLDEIGDLPPSAQVRLLRVLQQKELTRVGGTQPIKINVRIITATHHNLEHMVEKNEFRKDLWFRINVVPISIPPLRQRKEDIPEIVEYFISRKSQEMNLRHRPRLSPIAIMHLQAYDWPGNVRELENCVERELIQNTIGHQNAVLDFNQFEKFILKPSVKRSQQKSDDIPLSYDEISRRHFKDVLIFTQGKIQGSDGAAAVLGMEPNTLRHHLKKLGIPYGKKTPDEMH